MTSNENPTLEAVIIEAIEDKLIQINTCLPGEFVSYDSSKRKATIKVSLKKKYADNTVKEYPLLLNVPVVFPRTAKAIVHLPVKTGDKCLVLFSQRSLDRWKKFGGTQDPADPRKFHLSDAIAIPGLYAFDDALAVDNPDAITVMNDTSIMEVQTGGKFKLQKKGGDEIIQLLVDITEQLSMVAEQLGIATTNTVFGAMQLNNFAQFNTIKTQVDTLKSKLDALRGD